MRNLESVGAEEVLSTLRAVLHVIGVGENLGRRRCALLIRDNL